MEHRAILIDPYDREVYELQTTGSASEIRRLISNDEGDTPCGMFSHVNFGGSTGGFVDDQGNWTQFEWFALVDDARLFCGRMVMLGSTYDGEVANLDADITTRSVADKVIWLSDAGAIEQAKQYMDAMAQAARSSDIPVISLDDGLVGRITDAVANKERKQFARLETRSYRSQVGYPRPDDTEVGIFESGRAAMLLPKCLDQVNHSPDGFSWGYYGSGPAQLAYAILFNVTSDADKSQRFYQDYKCSVIAELTQTPWEIKATSVWDWLDERVADAEKDRVKA